MGLTLCCCCKGLPNALLSLLSHVCLQLRAHPRGLATLTVRTPMDRSRWQPSCSAAHHMQLVRFSNPIAADCVVKIYSGAIRVSVLGSPGGAAVIQAAALAGALLPVGQFPINALLGLSPSVGRLSAAFSGRLPHTTEQPSLSGLPDSYSVALLAFAKPRHT